MRKLISLLLLLALCLSSKGQTGNESLPELYRLLDDAIAHSAEYIQQRETDISKLKAQLAKSTSADSRYDLAYQLFGLYRSYQNDSCMHYLNLCIDACKQRGQQGVHDAALCKTLLARQASAVGFYTEAISILNAINRRDLDKAGIGSYYIAANHIYGELGRYSTMEDQSQHFYHKADLYADSMLAVLPENNKWHIWKRQELLLAHDSLEASMDFNDRWMMLTKPFTPDYSLVTFYRQWTYSKMNDQENTKRWLILSSLSDVRNAINDQASLWDLADILQREGDLKRSARYVDFAWRASIAFGSRLRSWQISPVVTAVDRISQQQKAESHRRLMVAFSVLALLVVLLLSLLIYAQMQRRKVIAMRDSLGMANEQLSVFNQELQRSSALIDEKNQLLERSNKALEDANLRLQEDAHLKEEYIGQLIVNSSQEQEQLNDFKRKMTKLLKARNFDAMTMELKVGDRAQGKDSARLFARFDETFLELFPTFVDDLNRLVSEESRIMLKDPTRLNTVARVFALIRLGIDDSTKIANFLHCSLSTIYNYRVSMRNAALGERNDFEDKVKRLGGTQV